MKHIGSMAALALALLFLAGCAPVQRALAEPLPAEVLVVEREAAVPAFTEKGIEAPVPTATPEPTPEPEPVTVTVRVTGDLMLHEAQAISAKSKDGSYSFSEYFTYMKDELSCADLTIGNLETPVTGAAPKGYPSFNAPVEYLQALQEAGFDGFTLANNHILDQKSDGVEKTIGNLEALGLSYCGASAKSGGQRWMLADVKGVQVAFVAFTYGANGHSDPKDQVSFLTDKNVKRDIKAAKEAGADLVVALPHWGAEYYEGVHSSCKTWAKKLADAGADVILGSHPHVVEPVETVTAADGRRVTVAYSMGNFISNQQKDPTYTGLLVELQITKTPAGDTTIDRVGYIPTFVYKHSGKAKYMYEVLPLPAFYEEPLAGMDSAAKRKLKKAWDYAQRMLAEGDAVLLELQAPADEP